MRQSQSVKRCRTVSLFVAVFLLAAAGTRAEEAAKAPKKWKDAAELTFLNTTGNSRTATYGASNLFSVASGKAGLDVKAAALGAKNRGTATVEQYNASEKFRWQIDGMFYVFEYFGWDKDRFAGIRNRYDFSAGPGAMLLNTPKDNLLAEAGAGYVVEERIGAPTKRFASGRFYGKYTRTLSASANFSQDVKYIRNFEDGRDYRVATETSVLSALSTHLSLKASYQWKRTNQPPASFVKDDTLTALALIVNY